MRRLAVALALLALSCGPTSRPDFVVHLVNAQGGNPFETLLMHGGACTSGTIRVDVQQGTNDVLTSNAMVNGAMIASLSVEIPSYALVTQIEVHVACASGMTLVGATPHFAPVGYGFVDIVLGEPSTCDPLVSPTLTPSRIAPSMVTLGANVLMVGGRASDGSPFQTIQALDPVRLTYATAPVQSDPISIGIGLGGAAALTSTQLFFVSSQRTGTFDATPGTATPVVDVAVHEGGTRESAVVGLAGNGVAVVGGFDGTAAVSGITWISPTGVATQGSLAHPRRRPSAVVLGGTKLLIVGGQDATLPLFEIVELMSGTAAIPFGPNEARYAPVIATDVSGSHAFVALGTSDVADDTSAVAGTYALSACTTAGCGMVVPGAPIATEMLRGHVATVTHQVGLGVGTVVTSQNETLVVGGIERTGAPSRSIDRITVGSEGQFSVTAFGMLTVARDQPSVSEIGGGVVLVAGGADAIGNALNTVEICFPTELRPIGPAL